MLACGVLTYGGVSLFVVAFAVYPFAAVLFREADIPKRLLPGAIALGAFTLTMDALPGSPQIQNLIPTRYFGTDAYAAPLAGTRRRGGGPARRPALARVAPGAGGRGRRGIRRGTSTSPRRRSPTSGRPHVVRCVVPLLLVLVANFVLSRTPGRSPVVLGGDAESTFPSVDVAAVGPDLGADRGAAAGHPAALAIHGAGDGRLSAVALGGHDGGVAGDLQHGLGGRVRQPVKTCRASGRSRSGSFW